MKQNIKHFFKSQTAGVTAFYGCHPSASSCETAEGLEVFIFDNGIQHRFAKELKSQWYAYHLGK